MKIVKRKNLDSTKWSGGWTTELFIMPETADYKKREFEVRISTATVTLKESNFSPLAGIQRHLMILEGEMKICHEGQYEKDLKTYEQDSFLGDYTTSSSSLSTVVDFNLMIQGTLLGKLNHYSVNEEEVFKINESCLKLQHKGYYCHLGEGHIELKDSKTNIEQGDYAVIDASEYSDELKFIGDAELIEVTVWSE